jgi:hypothetical protein
MRLLGCSVVFLPIAAFASGYNIFPAVGAAAGNGQYVIASQAGASELLSAVKTAVIVATKKRAVAQGRAEALNNFALDGDNRLQVDTGAQAVDTLNTAKNRGQNVPYAVNDITFGIGCDGLV